MSTANDMHCTRLTGGTDAGSGHARGAALSITKRSMSLDELIEFEASALGEEIAAVLEGRVDIVAADEHYVLCAGEAILIPPQMARRYRCLLADSVLYRVVCNVPPIVKGEQQ